MKIISQIISWVFLPLFMPIYGLLFAFYVPSNQDYFFNLDCLYLLPPQAKSAFLYMFLIFGVFAPGMSLLILKKTKIISTIEIDDRRERGIPIIIMLLYCLILYFFLWMKSAEIPFPSFLYALPLSGVFVTAVFYFMNKWRKVSIHAGGAGILVGFIMAYFLRHIEYQFWILPLSILISGLVMSARVYLGKHTLLEVVTGWSTAVLITFLINYFY
mgnify:CR=1 FL=1